MKRRKVPPSCALGILQLSYAAKKMRFSEHKEPPMTTSEPFVWWGDRKKEQKTDITGRHPKCNTLSYASHHLQVLNDSSGIFGIAGPRRASTLYADRKGGRKRASKGWRKNWLQHLSKSAHQRMPGIHWRPFLPISVPFSTRSPPIKGAYLGPLKICGTKTMLELSRHAGR